MEEEKSVFDQWNDIMSDPEFIENMANFFKEKNKARERNTERIRKFFSDDESFEKTLIRILEKHDERWTDVCYAKSVQPHPWEILYSICNIVEDEGENVEPLDDFTKNWQSTLLKYRGYTFAWTNGQGTVMSIYNKDNELIFRD
jgi:hypothetical protein